MVLLDLYLVNIPNEIMFCLGNLGANASMPISLKVSWPWKPKGGRQMLDVSWVEAGGICGMLTFSTLKLMVPSHVGLEKLPRMLL